MKTIREDIKNRSFKKVYLLYGNEDYLKRSLKNQLKTAVAGEDEMNVMSVNGKDPDLSRLKNFTDTLPFFAEKRLIMMTDTGLFKSSSDGFVEWIETLPETACVIFTEEEADKRNRLFKKVSEMGHAAELNHPEEKELERWILGFIKNRGMNIRTDAYRLFLDCISEDMDDVQNELEKLCAYAADTGIITREDVSSICRVKTESRVFDMISAAAFKHKDEAFDLYYDLLALREKPLRILYLLGRELMRLLLIKHLLKEQKTRREIADALKVKPFICDKMMSQANMFSEKKLKELTDLALSLEKDVKTGDLDEQLSIELLLLKITED